MCVLLINFKSQTSADGMADQGDIVKARLHMRLFDAILMRFCVQNLPQPTPHGVLVA